MLKPKFIETNNRTITCKYCLLVLTGVVEDSLPLLPQLSRIAVLHVQCHIVHLASSSGDPTSNRAEPLSPPVVGHNVRTQPTTSKGFSSRYGDNARSSRAVRVRHKSHLNALELSPKIHTVPTRSVFPHYALLTTPGWGCVLALAIYGY